MRIFSNLCKLYKPGSSTKQFSPKLAKKLKFKKMSLSSLPQHLLKLKLESILKLKLDSMFN